MTSLRNAGRFLAAVLLAAWVLAGRSYAGALGTLGYSTFFGGSNQGDQTQVQDIHVDAAGNSYIVGNTSSDNMPRTYPAYGAAYGGGVRDGFLAKFDPDGQLVFSTYFGGAGEDGINSVTLSPWGDIVVTGLTYSNETTFPVTANALDGVIGGERDAFVAVFSSDGRQLLYSTYLGGTSWDYGNSVAVDSQGRIHIAGFTHGDFPTTAGAAQTAFGGMGDIYVAKLDVTSSSTTLLYSTYVGGSSWDGVDDIKVDSAGNAYLAAHTHSQNFPTTAGAYDQACDNCSSNFSTDGAVVKLNAAGQVVFSTLVGGAAAPGVEAFTGLALAPDGSIWLAGETNSADFPVTGDAYQSAPAGGFDAVLARLSADGAQLLYSTRYGGSGDDWSHHVALDNRGNAFLSGRAASADLPMSDRPKQAANAGGYDVFLAKFNADGRRLLASTYLGGSGNDGFIPSGHSSDMAMDASGNVYVAGVTQSADYPVTAGAFQSGPGAAAVSAFLTKMSGVLAPGWTGTVLLDGESLSGWSVDAEDNSAGTSLAQADGLFGKAVRLNWSMGSGHYAQAIHTFSQTVDLSAADIFGFSLKGGGPAELCKRIEFKFEDANQAVFGYTISTDGLKGMNQADRWFINHSVPKKRFGYWWGGPTPGVIDWTRIKKFTVALSADQVGGSGAMLIDNIQYDRAADWPTQAAAETIVPDMAAAGRAVDYLVSQQQPTGLVLSWKEEFVPAAWLYDQGLALLALSRAGEWRPDGVPDNVAAAAAQNLAAFLSSHQEASGRWPIGWNPISGGPIAYSDWVGDQSWAVMGMATYAAKSGDAVALTAAQKCGAWLAARVPASGKVVDSTEGNVDTWWALMSVSRQADADKIKTYLLNDVWDADLRYWWEGYQNPSIVTDAATWMAAFARHPSVGLPGRGLDSLRVAERALRTVSGDEKQYGIDMRGPLGVSNEGTAQYVSQGGRNAQVYLDQLLAQQRPDGGMPGSRDAWNVPLVWLSTWTGTAPTAWLYFALTGDIFQDLPAYGASSQLQSARLAFDGDASTRWESDHADNQWLSLDFAQPHRVKGLDIDWEAAFGRRYVVQTSDEGQVWMDLYAENQGDGGTDAVRFAPVVTRHLRLNGLERGTPWGFSVWELAVKYDLGAEASSIETPGLAAINAVDGNPLTRWSSLHEDPQWLQVNLGQARTVNKITIKWETAYARTYNVQVSADGTAWTEVYATAAGDGGEDVLSFSPTDVLYIRVNCLERATVWGHSIWELTADYQ